MNIIITFNENSKIDFKKLCLFEIKKFSKSVSLCKTNCDNYIEISNYIKDNSIFIRHIQPANILNNLDFSKYISNDYSIQIRTNDEKKKLYYDKIKNNLINFKENVKNPKQVISIYVYDNIIYGGVNNVKYNLSKWSGGECRYKINNMINRAELKLIETLEVFCINLKNYKSALDLGCSPGGWSKVLLENGINVVGIDPAEADKYLYKFDNFKHFKNKAENFRSNERFDLILNDMKMNFDKSLDVVKKLSVNLNKNGIIIMTVKLFKNDSFDKSFEYIKNNFIVLHKRQLYHNRNEYTVILKLL